MNQAVVLPYFVPLADICAKNSVRLVYRRLVLISFKARCSEYRVSVGQEHGVIFRHLPKLWFPERPDFDLDQAEGCAGL